MGEIISKASLYLRKDKWLCLFSATDSREIFEFKNIDNISEFLTNDKIFVHISEDCDIKTFYMWIKWLKKFREQYPEEYSNFSRTLMNFEVVKTQLIGEKEEIEESISWEKDCLERVEDDED